MQNTQESMEEFKRVKTISGLDAKVYPNSDNCNCNLSSFLITGEILFDGHWVTTKWNDTGKNISGIIDWTLNDYKNN